MPWPMPRLGVNIDHVASLRQLRRGDRPDPVEAARVCEEAGAGSIVCHLREDRRHIQDADVRRLRQRVRTSLNLEMSAAPGIVAIALRIRPDQVTLVPERRAELTTEGGLDAARLAKRLGPVIRAFDRRGIRVSLFVDPSAVQLRAARSLEAPMVELHTGGYANATTASSRNRQLRALRQAAGEGRRLGLRVAAGHGLDYGNVQAVAAIPEIEELNIGYSMIVRALTVGLGPAVKEMVQAIRRGRSHAGRAR